MPVVTLKYQAARRQVEDVYSVELQPLMSRETFQSRLRHLNAGLERVTPTRSKYLRALTWAREVVVNLPILATMAFFVLYVITAASDAGAPVVLPLPVVVAVVFAGFGGTAVMARKANERVLELIGRILDEYNAADNGVGINWRYRYVDVPEGVNSGGRYTYSTNLVLEVEAASPQRHGGHFQSGAVAAGGGPCPNISFPLPDFSQAANIAQGPTFFPTPASSLATTAAISPTSPGPPPPYSVQDSKPGC